MAVEDECSASEFADMIERSAAKFRADGRSSPPLPLPTLREQFEVELNKEVERRAAARAQGAAARRELRV